MGLNGFCDIYRSIICLSGHKILGDYYENEKYSLRKQITCIEKCRQLYTYCIFLYWEVVVYDITMTNDKITLNWYMYLLKLLSDKELFRC